MQLPGMRYREDRKRKEINGFGGLDRTDGAGDGYLTEAVNLSARRYPFLAVREGRQVRSVYVRPTALYAWGDLVLVDGTDLIYKGEKVGTVSEGAKQFAVVNTKLVIWPDKAILDLSTGRFTRMEATANIQGTVRFTANTLTVESQDKSAPVLSTETENTVYDSDKPVKVKRYTGLDWVDGQWVKTGEEEVTLRELKAGDLLVPSKTATGVYAMNTDNGGGYGEENRDGVYLKVTQAVSTGSIECRWEKWECRTSYYSYYAETGFEPWFENDVDNAGGGGDAIGGSGYYLNRSTGQFVVTGSKVIHAGGSGTVYTLNGEDLLRITYTSTGANSSHYVMEINHARLYSGHSYSKGTTSYGDVYAEKGIYPSDGRGSDGYWYVLKGETGFEGTVKISYDVRGQGNQKFTSLYSVGDRVNVSGCVTQTGNNVEKAEIVKVEDYVLTFADGTFTAANETGAVSVQKPAPDLDYICASDNRLWGVSNAERTIYASALGLPDRFWDYAGVSTDSYAVAVGSDGDWSGIIDYSGSVLCWKEDVLHRVAGDYPATYSVYTDSYDGVEIGSHKSMRIINEVLYYKGRNGIYAYTGGQPVCVSQRLGRERYVSGAAGVHAGKYYISMRNGAGTAELFAYDTVSGAWYREDDAEVTDFAELSGSLYALIGNQVYEMDGGPVADVEWSGTLAEFTENSCQKRMYRWLRIGAEIGEDSWLRVEISVDGRPAELVWQTGEPGRRQLNLPLRGMRAERMSVTLSGKGDVVIRYVARDYIELSEET